jgi:NAD(P)-dependent dehydrogenase (short-subunit alcohol dehydrogenase family)
LALGKMAAAEGAEVILGSRDENALAKAVGEIGPKCDGRSLVIECEQSVQEFFEGIGTIDHLATPGFAVLSGRLDDMPIPEARAAFDAKFWGQFYCARYAQMQPLGSITLFEGIFHGEPAAGFGVLAAINGAVQAMGEALALELAPIRVNVIAPGLVDTQAYRNLGEAERQDYLATVRRAVPVQRIGKPEDVASAVLLLMKNLYVTGAILDLDGDSVRMNHHPH